MHRIPIWDFLFRGGFMKKFDINQLHATFTDESNSVISSMSEYKKTKELKLSVKDDFSGIDENGLYYYLAWENSDGSCPTSVNSYSSYMYENGVLFEIGSKLNSGKMCMYFEASSVMGNVYKSEYYHFMFDNESYTQILEHKHKMYNQSTISKRN